MYVVAESLRKDSFQLIIRGFISPYLEAFEPQDINEFREFVTKDEFFDIIRRFRFKQFGYADADELYDTNTCPRFEAEVWGHLHNMSSHLYEMLAGPKADSPAKSVAATKLDLIRRRSLGLPARASMVKSPLGMRDESEGEASVVSSAPSILELTGEVVPEGCISFTNLRIMAVLGTDGVITSAAQREAMNKVLDDYVDRTGLTNITREEFVVELPKYERKFPVLAHLDFETIAFYLFPEKDANVTILRRLIDMTHSPPIRSTFITDYTKTLVVKGADIRDLIWFVPFLVLYICVVMSGRGVTPRSYMGRGIVLGLNTAIDGYDFPTCTRDSVGNFTCDDSAIMTIADITGPDHVYGFLQGSLPNLFWPSGDQASGGETLIANSLRVSGALKIRQQRVRGESSVGEYPVSFFDPVYTPKTLRYPGYSSGGMNKASFPPASTFVRDRVLMPWDGSKYGTCSQLNGTGKVAGINKDIDCDGYAVIVPFNATRGDFTGIVGELLSSKWIAEDTRNIIVDAVLFHLDSVMFVKLQLLFEFQAGGAVTTSRQVTPFLFHDSASQSTLLDVAFYLFIALLVVLVGRFIYKQLFGGVVTQLQQWKWILLDFLCLVMFLASIIVRLLWIVLGPPGDPVWQLDHYPHQYEYAAQLYLTMTSLDGFSVVFAILAIFRFTKFVGGLNAVVNTLQRSVVDGIVIAFLAGSILFAFAICAMIVWGDRLVGYQTVPTAALTLLLAFIGSFDYRPLREDEPTFSFIFFAVFILIAIATLLNMVIAIFSDSFSDEQEVSFKAVNLMSILENNYHHMLDRWTPKTYVQNLAPVHFAAFYKNKIVAKFGKSNDDSDLADSELDDEQRLKMVRERQWDREFQTKFNGVAFDTNIMVAVLYTLQPSWRKRSSQASVSRRVQAAAVLLKLIDRYVELPRCYPETVDDDDESTSVYDYARSLFGSFDYSLIMTLLVIVPQTRFGYAGVNGLLEAAQAQKRWFEQMSKRAVQADESEVLSLRLAALDARMRIRRERRRERGLRGEASLNHQYSRDFKGFIANAVPKESQGESAAQPADGVLSTSNTAAGGNPLSLKPSSPTAGAMQLEGSLSSTGKRRMEQEEEDETHAKSFDKFCESMDYLTRRVFLGILACARPHHFAPDATLTASRFEEIAKSIEDYPHEDYPARDLYMQLKVQDWLIAAGRANEPFTMLETMPDFQGEFASQCLGFGFSQEEVRNFEEAIFDTLVVPSIETRDTFNVNREEFSEIWKAAKGYHPPAVTIARVENIFPNNVIDLRLFLHYCRVNPFAHQKRSFQSVFAAQMARVSTFLTWSAFYVPFLAFLIVVAQVKYSADDNIHVSVGLRNSFAPSEDVSLYTLDQVNSFLGSTVSGIWSGTSTEKALPHNFVNFFIGSLRVRQVRVSRRRSSVCNRVFKNFFGNSGTRALDFPSSFSPSDKSFYSQRVQKDFASLVSNDCYYAYDAGSQIAKANMAIPPSVTSPLAQAAFSFRDESGTRLSAHDSTYIPSGYYIDMPFNLTTDEAKALINELTNTSWLDAQTRMVVAEFAVFNNNLRLYSHARFGFEITSGGAMYPIRHIVTAEKPRGMTTTPFIVIAVLTWVLIALYLYLFFNDLLGTIRDRMLRLKLSALSALLSTIPDSPLLVLDLSIIVLMISSWVWTTSRLLDFDVGSLSNGGNYPDSLEVSVSNASRNKIIDGCVIVLACVRLLNILSLNDRVNLLFETFKGAFNDLIALLVLFVICLIAFSLGAILLFGYLYNDEFSFQNSFFDFFNTVSGGDSTYPDLVQLRKQVSVIFFILFFVVCSYILYNMVIAVLTGAFSDAKANLYDPSEAEEVLSQAFDDNNLEDKGPLIGKRDVAKRLCSSVTAALKEAGNVLRRNIVLREFYVLWVWIKRKTTSSNSLVDRCRVGRSLWANQAHWWSAVDSSLPRQSCLAGLNLLILDKQTAAEQSSQGSAMMSANVGGPKPLMVVSDAEDDNQSVATHLTKYTKHTEEGDDADAEANEMLPRFRSYGERRRLPLWQEFLYSKFQADYPLIQRHVVEVPAYLLAQREESIWLQVLSVSHYFKLDKELYALDLGDDGIDGNTSSTDVRGGSNSGDQSDSDQDEMAWLATVAGFANDARRPSVAQTNISHSNDATPSAVMRRTVPGGTRKTGSSLRASNADPACESDGMSPRSAVVANTSGMDEEMGANDVVNQSDDQHPHQPFLPSPQRSDTQTTPNTEHPNEVATAF